MKITKVLGREIYDSRGWPTIQCGLELDGKIWVQAASPSGLSRGKHEACELRDGGSRLWGRGVLHAVEHIDYIIGPALLDQEPDGKKIDAIMLDLDGTPDKSHLGANTLLAVSKAVHRAQALKEGLELFELIAYLLNSTSVTMPFPQFNVINGGVHADNKLPIQEFLVVPVGVPHFRSALELGISTFHELKALLQRHEKSTAVGDEGGFAPFITIDEALLSICDALQRVSGDETRSVIALDMAASQLFDPEYNCYRIYDTRLSTDELIEWYKQLIELYPIYSLEDPFAEDDWEGWQKCMSALGDKVQIVADDLCVTNSKRLQQAIDSRCMTAAIIKPNQVGTITETLEALTLCRQHNINAIISHRSGETNDDFIADLAVGASTGQIKAGGCCRGERLAKYNRLLAIEDMLFWNGINGAPQPPHNSDYIFDDF
jgi:enolase